MLLCILLNRIVLFMLQCILLKIFTLRFAFIRPSNLHPTAHNFCAALNKIETYVFLVSNQSPNNQGNIFLHPSHPAIMETNISRRKQSPPGTKQLRKQICSELNNHIVVPSINVPSSCNRPLSTILAAKNRHPRYILSCNRPMC
jgi:hypothetical protein